VRRAPAAKGSAKAISASTHAWVKRRRLVSHPLVAWLTLLAIAGTLCACGRYGPPQRRAPEASATGAANDTTVSPAATTPEYPSEDENDGEESRDDGERRDERDD
jgi:hypothetical protein